MASKYSAVLQQLSSAFPDLVKPVRDQSTHKAIYNVLDILLNARAPHGEIRAVAHKWSSISDEIGDSKTAISVFERLHETDPQWREARAARARLLLHTNKPTAALKLLDAWNKPEEFAGLRGLCFIRSDPAQAEKLLTQAEDFVNLAALKDHQGIDSTDLWKKAVERRPNSLAALNGAKKFDEVISREYDNIGPKSEFDARVAQALTGLATKARIELFAVTSEGLFRSAISSLEKSAAAGKKPVYTIQLCHALEEYALLLKKWEKREKEAEALEKRAKDLRAVTSSFLPTFAFDLPGWTIDE